ncbi:hypothetical protein VTN77DRAFT_5642 [Rasamsonia byssochlamydoides]|uniref:uncharacterized protein n=1 Tax=Rasamsonia byssochlamydoides TaxID=89139 RepID=UPI003743BBF2
MAAGNVTMEESPAQRPRRSPASAPAKIHYPFWFGGSASCFAASVTHPLDLVKVKMPSILLHVFFCA